jgi:hypothetical protein
VALRIDIDAFRSSLPSAVLSAASRLLQSGAVSEIEPAGGGFQAVVRDDKRAYLAWIGVADRDFIGECDCDAGDLCAHAVAVALTGFEQGVTWSGLATPPSAVAVTPEQARLAEAVARLAPRQVSDLIIAHAARDRLFAATLLRAAGLLEPTSGEPALRDFRLVLREVSNVTTGRWQISDVETAGQRLAAEAEILCVHLASEAALELVEEAILVWDDLSGHLHDAHHHRRIDPEDVGYPLTEAHRALCEQLGLDSGEVAERVTALVGRCDYETLDVEAYSELLSDEDFETLTRPMLQ